MFVFGYEVILSGEFTGTGSTDRLHKSLVIEREICLKGDSLTDKLRLIAVNRSFEFAMRHEAIIVTICLCNVVFQREVLLRRILVLLTSAEARG